MTKNWLSLLILGFAVASAAHGCGDSDVQCLGTAVACESRDPSQCIAGCSVREGCFGGRVSCESLTSNPQLCLQSSCRYVGTCEGGDGCEDRDYNACLEGEGCIQVERCFGDGFTCEGLEDSQCELFDQCELGRHCVGNARSCGALDSVSTCQEVPGCLPADTSPAVVD